MNISKRFAKNRRAHFVAPRIRLQVEQLETRSLLSAAILAATPAVDLQPLLTNLTPTGLSPAQVKHAYGIDQTGLTGAGQTIAIVDDILHRTSRFVLSIKSSVPRSSLTQMVQVMGPLPQGRSGGHWRRRWMEWAHAVAGAKILRSSRSDLTNLLSAVICARIQACPPCPVKLGPEFRGNGLDSPDFGPDTQA